jgi:hypothetical protein
VQTLSSVSKSLYLRDGVSAADFGVVGMKFSVLDAITLGSRLSLLSFARLGSGISTLQDGFIGGSPSVYGRGVVGSSLSVLGLLSVPLKCRRTLQYAVDYQLPTSLSLEAR